MWRTIVMAMFAAQLALLELACTSFTIFPGLGNRFSIEFFRISSASGWGYRYESHYTLPVVLTFIAAYGLGASAYVIMWRHGARVLAGLGAAVCALGAASFAFEATHWVAAHNRSMIVSLPPVVLVLDLIAIVMLCAARRAKRASSPADAAPGD